MFQYLGINESDPVAGVNLKALEGQNGGKDHISQGHTVGLEPSRASNQSGAGHDL